MTLEPPSKLESFLSTHAVTQTRTPHRCTHLFCRLLILGMRVRLTYLTQASARALEQLSLGQCYQIWPFLTIKAVTIIIIWTMSHRWHGKILGRELYKRPNNGFVFHHVWHSPWVRMNYFFFNCHDCWICMSSGLYFNRTVWNIGAKGK